MEELLSEVDYTKLLIDNLDGKSSLQSVSRLSPFAWLYNTNCSYKQAMLDFVKKGNSVQRITILSKEEFIENIFTREILTKGRNNSSLNDTAFSTYLSSVYHPTHKTLFEKKYYLFKQVIGNIILDSLCVFRMIHSDNGAIIINETTHCHEIGNSLKENYEILIYNDTALSVKKIGHKYKITPVAREKVIKDWKQTFDHFAAIENGFKLFELMGKIEEHYCITDFATDNTALKSRLNPELFREISLIERLEEKRKKAKEKLLNKISLKEPKIASEIVESIPTFDEDFLNFILDDNNITETIIANYKTRKK
jgi:hypothetical protein